MRRGSRPRRAPRTTWARHAPIRRAREWTRRRSSARPAARAPADPPGSRARVASGWRSVVPHRASCPVDSTGCVQPERNQTFVVATPPAVPHWAERPKRADREVCMATATIDGALLEALSASFSGTVLLPGDDGYDEARLVHNGLVDRRPALIARCRERRRHRGGDRPRARERARDLGAGRRAQRRRPRRDRRRADDRPLADEGRSTSIRGAAPPAPQGGALWADFNEATARPRPGRHRRRDLVAPASPATRSAAGSAG